MSEQYDQVTAMHYSAYRPPLHSLILNRAITSKSVFEIGLDIGCGTGYSSVALLEHCKEVSGIDPSESMLEKVEDNDNIHYQVGSGDQIPLADNSVDIVTFAGSLSYAKSEQLIKEIQRVANKDALVVVYDFQVVVADVLSQLGVRLENTESDYDHEVNFSDVGVFSEIVVKSESVSIDVSMEQLAHVLLSGTLAYKELVKKYHVDNPFNSLVSELNDKRIEGKLKSLIYYSAYKIR